MMKAAADDEFPDATPEQRRLAQLVMDTLDKDIKLFNDGVVKMAVTMAARAVLRGRHLTPKEQLENLAKAMAEDDPDGITADEWFKRITRR